jgi:hypothetical protein
MTRPRLHRVTIQGSLRGSKHMLTSSCQHILTLSF